MAIQKKPVKYKQLKQELEKEIKFLQNIFAIAHIPLHSKDDDNDDFEMDIVSKNEDINKERAASITELEDKLQKLKSQNKFNLKSKLTKKSLNSKLNKKLKKKDRVKINKNKANAFISSGGAAEIKPAANIAAKPIFNNDGKLVFSKFDFASVGERRKAQKAPKDPKKILENLKQQEERLHQIAEKDSNKAKEIKDKLAWKNILQKAEGEKVKDDLILLKKSIKKMEHKKKVSKKKWDTRIEGVEKKKQDRQNKRRENISKKKKEKKAKVVKAAVKRGRVVI